eukprot:4746298-Pleurochrysis_carterae.AAC.1
MERPRRHMSLNIKEEELALRQMISGTIPEWQEANDKEKKGTIVTMKLWTGEMMNWARIQMKTRIEKKNEHKASVQRRWGNRGNMNKAFKRWKPEGWEKSKRGRGGKKEEDIWNETLGQGQDNTENTHTGQKLLADGWELDDHYILKE